MQYGTNHDLYKWHSLSLEEVARHRSRHQIVRGRVGLDVEASSVVHAGCRQRSVLLECQEDVSMYTQRRRRTIVGSKDGAGG